MRLLSIHAKCFKQHADSYVELPLGVVGFIGDNEAGKSNLAVEAVKWALFGAAALKGTKGGIRWHGAPARHTASVTLRFELAGKTYRIERGESGAKLFDEGTGFCLADGTDPVNKEVPKILGMGPFEFQASFLCSQKDLSRIANMDPVDRQAFVRRVMGHEKIDAALKACRIRKSALSQERDGLILGLGERGPLEEAIVQAQTARHRAHMAMEEAYTVAAQHFVEHQTADEALTASTDRKSQHEAHDRALKYGRTAKDAAALEVGRLTAKLDQVAGARGRIAAGDLELAAVPALRVERDGLVAARAAVSEQGLLAKRVGELESEIDGLSARIDDGNGKVAEYDAAAHAAASIALVGFSGQHRALYDSRTQARAAAEASMEAHRKEVAKHERRIKAIEDAGPRGHCPTCARTLGDAYAAVVEILRTQLDSERGAMLAAQGDHQALAEPSPDEREADAAVATAQAEAARWDALRRRAEAWMDVIKRDTAALATAEKALGEARARLAKLPAVTFDPARLHGVEADLARLDRLDKALAGDRALVAQEAEARGLLAEREKMLEAAGQQVADAEAGLRALAFDPQEHARIAGEAEGARRAAEAARVALARAEEAERGAAAQVAGASAALDAYDARAIRLHEVSADHLTHEHTAARLADFRVAIASTIRPEMEELMSGFIQVLTDGRHESVTLTENFEAVLQESGVPVEVVSGGTEDLSALAMRLALSQMITERAGHPLSLLVLDEVFGSLDEGRRANVLTLIRRLRSVFPQVVVISHVAETREAVDHAIELEYDEANGKTVVL